MRCCLLILILTLSGCTGWRTTAGKTMHGLESLARNAEAFEVTQCGRPMDIAAKCKSDHCSEPAMACTPPIPCPKLDKCETVAKSLLTFRIAILTASHALLETERTKEVVQALVQAAMKAYKPVASLIGVWK